MVRGGKVLAPDGAHQLDQQHGHTHRHVKPVETSEHKKRRAINAGIERQAIQDVSLVILGSL